MEPLCLGTAVIVPYTAAIDLVAKTQDCLPLRGVIVGYGPITCHDAPESERLMVVEMPEEFPGGHDCQGKAKAWRGAYVTAKHLQLAEYTTVPDVSEQYNQHVRDRQNEADKKA